MRRTMIDFASAGMCKLNEPLSVVFWPTVVPAMMTWAAGIGTCSAASVTRPLMRSPC